MSKLLFMLFLWLVQTDWSFQTYARAQCSLPEIPHGRVRRRSGARLARFSCSPHYDLVGNKYATCRFGRWDVPLPVCVRAGCEELEIDYGMTIPSHRGAWTMFYCFPGYQLAGSPALYCDGYRWNATTPKCVPGLEPQLSCDFESEDLCGWRQDELHDFDWTRLNTKTPSSFLLTGPSYDHTFGKGFSGYYMFIESTSKLTNDSARLISPIYEGSLTKNGCFSFFYHMYGKSIGGLRVYQMPEGLHQLHGNLTWSNKTAYLLFEKWGDHGDFWFRNVSKLRDTADNFQIVIEGIRGNSFTSDIAIDDVAILQGADCDAATLTAVTPPEISETCAGRCDILGNSPSGRSCGCTAGCITDDNCCPDFFEICVYNSGQGQSDDDDSIDSRTSDQPLTEKLIRTPSTPPSSTNTTVSTTSLLTNTTTPTPRSFTAPRPTRVTIIITKSTTTPMPTTSTTTSTTTTRKPRSTAKTPPATRRTVSTTRPTTTRTTTRPTSTTRAPSTTRVTPRVVQNATSVVQSDAAKSKMEQAMQTRKVAVKQTPSSSGSTAAIITTLLLAAGCALAAAALRSARGRAAVARLRARAASDPEVRYLTRDDD